MLNFSIVKELVTKHVDMMELANRLAWAGARVEELEELNLFEIALDLVGFPDNYIQSRGVMRASLVLS